MKKGLVKLRPLLNQPPCVVGDATREPVNMQAVRIIRKASWIEKPMPVDPDLSDRKVVLQFLKERAELKSQIIALEDQVYAERQNYRKAIAHFAAEKSKMSAAELEILWGKQTVKQLSDEIDRIQQLRFEMLNGPDFSLKFDIILKRIQDSITAAIANRPKSIQ